MKDSTSWQPTAERIPDPVALGQDMGERLAQYLRPLLVLLDRRLDSRLVRTFAATVVNIVCHRDRALCLLLTELGEMLTDGAHAPAGVKRLWNLVRSPKWVAGVVHEWLLEDADRAVEAAVDADGDALLALDGSVIEKATARKLEGLTKVRSTQARLLRRASGGPPIKPPILVPGFNWVAAVVCGLRGSVTLARLHWYSSKAPGREAQTQREAEWSVLEPLIKRWGLKVLCLLDRGFAGRDFLVQLLGLGGRFIVRWRNDYHLMGPKGEQAAGLMTRPLRSTSSVDIYCPYTRQTIRVGVAAIQVTLVGDTTPLWLVVARRKGGDSMWLLTTDDASQPHLAVTVVLTYSRRWQVEWTFLFGKSGIGLPSIRVRIWEYRQKLWVIAELVHAFLLHLLILDEGTRQSLLRWCHRTGRKVRQAVSPLSRLRHALANIWRPNTPTLAWQV